LLLLEPLQASMYTCANTKVANCSRPERNHIRTIGKFDKIGDALWEVSFIPFPNWNGRLVMEFVVYDEFLSSEPETCKVKVWPINDAPTIVAETASVHGIYYYIRKNGDFVRAPQSDDQTKFEIHDDKASNQRELEGKTIKSEEGSGSFFPIEENPDPNNKLVIVEQLKFKVQDIDFFFGLPLQINATLLKGTFPKFLMENHVKRDVKRVASTHPCSFKGDWGIECVAEIVALNEWLFAIGMPILIDDDSPRAVGIFLLNDTGNIDKLDRPLASGFTIVFYKPGDEEVLVTPIAALVILPVIAAVTAASIAAAWLLLGNRAQQYVGASFDAMAADMGSGGQVSPLYDAKGLDVQSSLYSGTGHV